MVGPIYMQRLRSGQVSALSAEILYLLFFEQPCRKQLSGSCVIQTRRGGTPDSHFADLSHQLHMLKLYACRRLMNLVAEKWPGQNRTRQTGSAASALILELSTILYFVFACSDSLKSLLCTEELKYTVLSCMTLLCY